VWASGLMWVLFDGELVVSVSGLMRVLFDGEFPGRMAWCGWLDREL